MFTVTAKDILRVLHDYAIQAESFSFTELERYHYEDEEPESREVRLIVKVDLHNAHSLVLRFKNEDDAPQEVIEAQSSFAALLYSHGIETPKNYASDGRYARCYTINGYDVIVTVEDFEEGQISLVDSKTAGETGELLAKMHNIAEEADFHVCSGVLFDPLTKNELFSFDGFDRYKEKLLIIDSGLYHAIIQKHAWLVSQIEPFGSEPRYAVQGDISDCNLYRTRTGKLGIFDFNRCGDNQLFFDAVMQAVFEARLMDYPNNLAGHQEEIILSAFLGGYQQIRPFSNRQKAAFPYLYALINAFWGVDMNWIDRDFTVAVEKADDASIHQWMKKIHERESKFRQIPE